MTREIDVGVVGAGPAGARAAELLAGSGLGVVMFDPRVPWEKPCGGGLTAAALDHVPELAEVLSLSRRIDTVCLEAGSTGLNVLLDRAIHVVSRTALGRWQLERARDAGAVLEPVRVRRIARRDNGGWRIWLVDERQFRARFLVGADGAASLVRKAVAPQLDVELAPARVVFVPGIGARPTTIGLRFYSDAAGYAWDFPRRSHRSIGVGVTPGSWQRARMDVEIDRYWRQLGRCLCSDGDRVGAVIGTARRFRRSDYRGIGGVDYALLGDAAGLADPATGEGILNALRSAAMLAEAWSTDGSFARYPGLVAMRLEPEFRIARLVRRVLHSGGRAHRLIKLAGTHPRVRALLLAIVNGGNEHDARLVRRLARSVWWSGDRVVPPAQAFVVPALNSGGARQPAPPWNPASACRDSMAASRVGACNGGAACRCAA